MWHAQLIIPFNEPEIMLYRGGALEVKRYAKPASSLGFDHVLNRPQRNRFAFWLK